MAVLGGLGWGPWEKEQQNGVHINLCMFLNSGEGFGLHSGGSVEKFC